MFSSDSANNIKSKALPPKLGKNFSTGTANIAPKLQLGIKLYYTDPAKGTDDEDRMVVSHTLPMHVANAPEVSDSIPKQYAVIGELFTYNVPKVVGGFPPISYFIAGPPRSIITNPLLAHAYLTDEDADARLER